MPIFDAATGDEVLFLCYSCDRYHGRLGTTSRHWRTAHGAANLFDPNQVMTITRSNLEALGVAAIKANPPPQPQVFRNFAGDYVNSNEHIYLARPISPESSPEPVVTGTNPHRKHARIIQPAFQVRRRYMEVDRVTGNTQTNTTESGNTECSSSSSSDLSDDDDDQEIITRPEVLRGAPTGIITPINEPPELFRNEIIDQWYQDPYNRPTGEGPAGDLLRRKNLEDELRDRGLSVRRAKATADYLIKCGGRIKTEEEIKNMSRAARAATKRAKKEVAAAPTPAALAAQTQTADEDEDDDEDDDDNESVVTTSSAATTTTTIAAAAMAPPSLPAHVPFTASEDEALELTDAEIDRRIAACKGSLRKFDLVYGEGGLEAPGRERESQGRERLWKVELENGEEVVTGDVTFGLSWMR